jgi:hypothetical protein
MDEKISIAKIYITQPRSKEETNISIQNLKKRKTNNGVKNQQQ